MDQLTVRLGLFGSIFLFGIVFIILFPFVQIWTINTLFQSSIEYSCINWFCIILLNSSLRSLW